MLNTLNASIPSKKQWLATDSGVISFSAPLGLKKPTTPESIMSQGEYQGARPPTSSPG